ncbi:MAG: HdeD family acid-resistance protein [Armatimonadota bacterium]
MIEILTRNWWALVVRGLLAIGFGVLALTWTQITLISLTLLFGAFALLFGIVTLAMAVGGWHVREDRWLLLVEGILGVAIGLLTYRSPGLTAVTLVLYVAAWTLIIGVLRIATAIRLRKEIEGEWWLALSGVLSLLAAVVLMWNPLVGAVALVWLIALYAIVLGIAEIGAGLRLRAFGRRLEARLTGAPAPSM